MEKEIARIALRFICLLKEDLELRDSVISLISAIADSQAAKAEYRRSLAARHKKG